MALTATEEAQVKALIAQNAALLSLASSEPTIISKLAATKVSLADLTAASTVADSDLFLVRQGSTEKSLNAATLKANVIAAVPSPPPGIPIGASLEWNGTTAPASWMIEDGRSLSKITYPALFDVIGYTFGGSGDNFNIPNSINRVAVGATGLYGVGATGGSKDAVVVAHDHTINDPGHGHFIPNSEFGTAGYGNGGSITKATQNLGEGRLEAQANSTGISINSAGVSGTDKNMMPYISKLKIIKVL